MRRPELEFCSIIPPPLPPGNLAVAEPLRASIFCKTEITVHASPASKGRMGGSELTQARSATAGPPEKPPSHRGLPRCSLATPDSGDPEGRRQVPSHTLS